MVRTRLRSQRVPASKPDSTEDPPYICACCAKNPLIRTVTAEDDDDDDDVTPVHPTKISHSEAVAALNTSLEWVEEQNFEAHEIMLLRRLRDRALELKIGTVAQKNH
ncbi:hypothetical protein AVEN_32679-1 [Araneus ventricosus]|uniref:Uncharacterized protein n=1 Tax=Araneus ventricosus TaxID=182803 RepID=A0A4Y2MWN6_ARAVE|nr:hypothetical protein AVEN_32679-1 [Araneus ventricosus]